MIKLAHAVYDENGKSCGGKAGDQNGKEVAIWDWYKSGAGWSYVFRAKNPKVAKKYRRSRKRLQQMIRLVMISTIGLHYTTKRSRLYLISARFQQLVSATARQW